MMYEEKHHFVSIREKLRYCSGVPGLDCVTMRLATEDPGSLTFLEGENYECQKVNIYDNGTAQPISGGSIVIHTK